MLTSQTTRPSSFVRHTALRAGEYNRKFSMIDDAIADAVSSPEADAVTPLMSKIYLRLRRTPAEHYERLGVLRFVGEEREGTRVTAWEQLCRHLRVSSETARKALAWLHARGIIVYSAYKNGVGIRICFNRAADSIGERPASAPQKNLTAAPASPGGGRASASEAAFNRNYSDRVSDRSRIPRATENVAAERPAPVVAADEAAAPHIIPDMRAVIAHVTQAITPSLQIVAARAAAQVAEREGERTREWLHKSGLPKVARVAQREAYNVFRYRTDQLDAEERRRRELRLGGTTEPGQPPTPRSLTPEEIREAAEMCLTMLDVQGRPIEQTLAEMSSGGGWLSPENVPEVRATAASLLKARGGGEA